MKLCPRQARARLATFDTSCYSWLSWGHSVRPATMHREKNLSVSSLPYCCEVSLDLGSLSTLAWVASLIYLLVILKSPAFRYWLQLAKAALQDRRKVSKSDRGGGAHRKRTYFEGEGFASINAKIWGGGWPPAPHFRRPYSSARWPLHCNCSTT